MADRAGVPRRFLPASPRNRPQERTAGKVLLLKNGNAIDGDITKVGTRMCVRRGKSEIWIDCDNTARLCNDWDDAYAYLQTRLKLNSADERLRFARWCQTQHLPDKALEQGRFAVQIDPDHREAKLFVAMLERMPKETPTKPNAAAVTPATAAPPHVDVNAETYAGFIARVQPILMNKCATCHAGGSFRLDHVAIGGPQVASRNNLNRVLAYLDVEKPAQSPMLLKALEAHGGAALPPFKDRKEVPVRILLAWIERTIATNPRVKEFYAAKKPVASADEAKPAPPNAGPVLVSRPLPRIEITTEPKAGPSEPVVLKQPQGRSSIICKRWPGSSRCRRRCRRLPTTCNSGSSREIGSRSFRKRPCGQSSRLTRLIRRHSIKRTIRRGRAGWAGKAASG